MRNLIEQMIKEAEYKLEQPNSKVDNYRAYWEGRISLAKQLLELPQAPAMLSLPSDEEIYNHSEDEEHKQKLNSSERVTWRIGAKWMRREIERRSKLGNGA